MGPGLSPELAIADIPKGPPITRTLFVSPDDQTVAASDETILRHSEPAPPKAEITIGYLKDTEDSVAHGVTF
jgi:hypothetical protein